MNLLPPQLPLPATTMAEVLSHMILDVVGTLPSCAPGSKASDHSGTGNSKTSVTPGGRSNDNKDTFDTLNRGGETWKVPSLKYSRGSSGERNQNLVLCLMKNKRKASNHQLAEWLE